MASPAYYFLNQSGSSGPDVALIQKWLNGIRTVWPTIPALTVDGKFGANTNTAVTRFQTLYGLTADGKVGVNTWNGLYAKYASIFGTAEQYPGMYIRSGTRGATVKSAQARLTLKGYTLNADGIFGSNTLAAVRAFQTANRLSPDGIIGPLTWAALYS